MAAMMNAPCGEATRTVSSLMLFVKGPSVGNTVAVRLSKSTWLIWWVGVGVIDEQAETGVGERSGAGRDRASGRLEILSRIRIDADKNGGGSIETLKRGRIDRHSHSGGSHAGGGRKRNTADRRIDQR